jgi:hypothetical protein
VVVVEGPADEAFIQGLLGGLTRVKVGNGASSAVSVARTLLTLGHRVALVLDADQQTGPALDERRRSLTFSLAMAATAERWCLVLIEPTLEQFLAGSPSVVKAVARTRAPKSAGEDADAAKRLLLLSRRDRRQKLAKLPKDAAKALLDRDPQLKKLAQFVASDRSEESAAASA